MIICKLFTFSSGSLVCSYCILTRSVYFYPSARWAQRDTGIPFVHRHPLYPPTFLATNPTWSYSVVRLLVYCRVTTAIFCFPLLLFYYFYFQLIKYARLKIMLKEMDSYHNPKFVFLVNRFRPSNILCLSHYFIPAPSEL